MTQLAARPDDPAVAQIVEAILQARRIAIMSHVGPDGDSIGTGLALHKTLLALGKEASFFYTDPAPPSCNFLPGVEGLLSEVPAGWVPDCLIVEDCAAVPERISAPAAVTDLLRQQPGPCTILIDHHITSEPVCQWNWIDATQPATALMALRLIELLLSEPPASIAMCLYCGLATDTGNFRFANTTPQALYAAGRLVEDGADPALVSFKLFDERSPEAAALLGHALVHMEAACNGRLRWSALNRQDFEESGASQDSSDNIINFLRYVRGTDFALLFRERLQQASGEVQTRLSVRCVPELRGDLFCNLYGGGGHAAAAGATLTGAPFDQLVQQVVQDACGWLNEKHPPQLPGPATLPPASGPSSGALSG